MKVEIISIGDDLLVSDVLDTNIAHLSRSLREIHVPITCKVTVGEDLDLVTDVLRVALGRADVVLAINSLHEIQGGVLFTAVKQFFDQRGDELDALTSTVWVESNPVQLPGVWLADYGGFVVCLPRDRQEMSYTLETAVLPFLRAKIQQNASQKSGWKLLRAVGVVESSVRLQLDDLPRIPGTRITFDSFAGQTSIRLWAEGQTEQRVAQKLTQLTQEVMERLGDHIYGEEEARLEQVILQMLTRGKIKLALAECHTNRIISQTLERIVGENTLVLLLPVENSADLAHYLHLSPLGDDLTGWCREAAAKLLTQSRSDLSLIVYKNVTQGGIQVLVILASERGVSVTQRSFGGHPENIDAWAFSLGMTHLRRWLRAHT